MAFRVKSPREDAHLNQYRDKKYNYLRTAIMFAWWWPVSKSHTETWLSPHEIVNKVNELLEDDAKAEWEISGVLIILYIDGYLEMEKEDQYTTHRFRPTSRGKNKLVKMHATGGADELRMMKA